MLNLQSLRRSQGLTQAQVAKRMGKSRSAISRLERHKDPWVDDVRKYVEALGGILDVTVVLPTGQRVRIPV